MLFYYILKFQNQVIICSYCEELKWFFSFFKYNFFGEIKPPKKRKIDRIYTPEIFFNFFV
jgi:hypothetical protein